MIARNVLLVLFVSVQIAAGESFIGTDLAFLHILRNKVPGSTADARPVFDLFYIRSFKPRLYSLFSVEYDWNTFTGGYIGALKTKACLGWGGKLGKTLPLFYAGVAPTWVKIEETSPSLYSGEPFRPPEPSDMFRDGFALDFLAGFRHILGHHRFFSFGYTVEYDFLVPFMKFTDVFVDESIGLNCVKAGFSFTFRLP